MLATLKRLQNAGVTFGSAIDIGCADGSFLLRMLEAGVGLQATLVNVDANGVYEPSLNEIRDVLGGHYWIGAIADEVGEIEINTAQHPYWSSTVPADNDYWRYGAELTGKMKVAASTVDALVEKFNLKPPHFIKLDVQGAEAGVLRGATAALQNTNIVLCETGLPTFQEINQLMVDAGFYFYDALAMGRANTGELGWFYPMYVKKSLDILKPRKSWSNEEEPEIIRHQEVHREANLKYNAAVLQRLRAAKSLTPSLPLGSRNALCVCGSGRKYKHCCGKHSAA